MRIFIVDDDANITRLLERIILDKDLGEVVGKSNDGIDAANQMKLLKPDICMVDLMMPGKDGISLVREIKSLYHNIQFIMISETSSKSLISQAYESGIEYYISKPIDAIEVQIVTKKVTEKILNLRKLNRIKKMFIDDAIQKDTSNNESLVRLILHKIGIMGESGTLDIINVVDYLIGTGQNLSNITITDLLSRFTENPRSMEQRIRRTATVGLINLANLGIEDYMNEIFVEYSNSIYSFEQLKIEMDFIRGKTTKRGTVNIKKFIDGIVYYVNRNN
ncbi:response regulator [Tissierella creatinini]|nr:response regulator [Tissierella creatinini]TJX65101.1 response regulator [Soehngenia saccharolytica]